jgi:hypothetical protein
MAGAWITLAMDDSELGARACGRRQADRRRRDPKAHHHWHTRRHSYLVRVWIGRQLRAAEADADQWHGWRLYRRNRPRQVVTAGHQPLADAGRLKVLANLAFC